MRFARACKRAGHLHRETTRQTPILVLTESSYPVALVGLLSPFILVTQDLMNGRTLSPEALELVLNHERSHAAHFDNGRLFSLYLLPRLNLRLRNGDTWMQLWQRTAEWAADEEAVGNDSDRALLLAETLVAVVRSSRTSPTGLIQAAFSCDEKDLIARVDRLIHRQPARLSSHGLFLALSVVAFGISAMLMGLSNWVPSMHSFSEYLLHLG